MSVADQTDQTVETDEVSAVHEVEVGVGGPGQDQEETWYLRLYVAGESPKSLEAFANLKQICEAYIDHPYEIEIVDLLQNPRLARGDEILAIPTLVRRLPAPMRKIIGDLSDTDRVLIGLQLRPKWTYE